jgi:uncharacterized protein YfaT (DUF1175 family)
MTRLLLAATLAVALLSNGVVLAQVRLADESDRAAFRSWFVLLADAQFERTTPDVIDCAALVRHAVREALKAHTPEWMREAGLPFTPRFADVRSRPRPTPRGWPLFRVLDGGETKYAEFADARTLIRLNSRSLGRSAQALRPGDLLYFHQPGQQAPDHVMVFVGRSHFEPDGDDWVVYHTGPADGGPGDPSTSSGSSRAKSRGEVRKVRLSTLMQHPSPRWRPVAGNPRFVGVFRLDSL